MLIIASESNRFFAAALHLNFNRRKKKMNKIIKSSILLFTMLIAVVMSGCDAFENFLFDLPISFEVEASGTNDASGSKSYCLTDNSTYQDYADKINSITYADAYFVTREVNPETISGTLTFQLLDGNNNTIITYVDNNITPANHDSTNAYHLSLDQSEIDDINASLAGGNRCFTGVYSVAVTDR